MPEQRQTITISSKLSCRVPTEEPAVIIRDVDYQQLKRHIKAAAPPGRFYEALGFWLLGLCASALLSALGLRKELTQQVLLIFCAGSAVALVCGVLSLLYARSLRALRTTATESIIDEMESLEAERWAEDAPRPSPPRIVRVVKEP